MKLTWSRRYCSAQLDERLHDRLVTYIRRYRSVIRSDWVEDDDADNDEDENQSKTDTCSDRNGLRLLDYACGRGVASRVRDSWSPSSSRQLLILMGVTIAGTRPIHHSGHWHRQRRRSRHGIPKSSMAARSAERRDDCTCRQSADQ